LNLSFALKKDIVGKRERERGGGEGRGKREKHRSRDDANAISRSLG